MCWSGDDNTSAAEEEECNDIEIGSIVRTPSGKIGTVSGSVSLLGLVLPIYWSNRFVLFLTTDVLSLIVGLPLLLYFILM